MEIKIIKSSKPSYWYADCVGKIFEVTNVSDDTFEVRKGVQFNPLRYEIAPVLKVDCEELIYVDGYQKYKEAKRNTEWRMAANGKKSAEQLSERSGDKLRREVAFYEKINKESEITIFKTDDKKSR